jgi:Leucine Rich repeat
MNKLSQGELIGLLYYFSDERSLSSLKRASKDTLVSYLSALLVDHKDAKCRVLPNGNKYNGGGATISFCGNCVREKARQVGTPQSRRVRAQSSNTSKCRSTSSVVLGENWSSFASRGLISLLEMGAVDGIDFRGNLTFDIVSTLCGALRQRSVCVRWLSLSRCSLGVYGCRLVTSLVRSASGSTLCSLDLSYAQLDSPRVVALARALRVNGALRVLSLAGNDLMTLESAEAIADMLRVNRTLASIDLSLTTMGNDGCALVFGALGGSIARLLMNDLVVDDAVVAPLGAMLERNSTLRQLAFEGNGIADAGLIALADALQRNCGLRALSLARTPTQFAGGARLAVARALRSHRTLSALDLSELVWRADAPFVSALCAALRANERIVWLSLAPLADERIEHALKRNLVATMKLQHLCWQQHVANDEPPKIVVEKMRRDTAIYSGHHYIQFL